MVPLQAPPPGPRANEPANSDQNPNVPRRRLSLRCECLLIDEGKMIDDRGRTQAKENMATHAPVPVPENTFGHHHAHLALRYASF